MTLRGSAALVLLSLGAVSAWALPPVTQAEAVAFHSGGVCQMMAPGQGITRRDGDGWIVSSLPGRHRILVDGKPLRQIEMTPGQPYPIHVAPAGGRVEWCPQYVPPGRDACGPVPKAFLYNAVKVGD